MGGGLEEEGVETVQSVMPLLKARWSRVRSHRAMQTCLTLLKAKQSRAPSLRAKQSVVPLPRPKQSVVPMLRAVQSSLPWGPADPAGREGGRPRRADARRGRAPPARVRLG